jgi:hypothetical protein
MQMVKRLEPRAPATDCSGDLVNWIISAQNFAIEQMEQYIAGGLAA